MKFYVTIKNSYGKNIDMEVSYEIYKLFDDERKANERERYERRKHLDDRDIGDYSIAGRYCFPTTEDIFLNREKLREVYAILKTCTSIQQERFYLYRICGYTYAEIAVMQKCHKRAIQKSVSTVVRKIKKYFSG